MNQPVSSTFFFSHLPPHRLPLSRLLDDESLFQPAPADWHVVVTDIKDSTRAFREGRHEEVNLIATGCIIASLNLAYKANIEIPFFFGGDGAALIVPHDLVEPVLKALTVHRNNTRAGFGLELRVGAVPVAELYAGGHALNLARLFVSDVYSIPVLLGDGLSEAERIVKRDDAAGEVVSLEPALLDLDGMECRWDRVEPSQPTHEVVSLVLTAMPGQRQAPIFKRVVELIDGVYGSQESRNPISMDRLRLMGGKLKLETTIRRGGFDAGYYLSTWLKTFVGGFFFFRTEGGRRYKETLVDLTDTLVIDGRINTVMAGTDFQRRELQRRLTAMEKEGLIQFGLFVSSDSVMSCYVRDRKDKHIHFVDGSDGGYTMAATMWKRKMRAGN